MAKTLLVLEATTGGTARHVAELASALQGSECGIGEPLQFGLVYSNLRDAQFDFHLDTMRDAGVELFEIEMQRAIAPLHDLRALWQLWRLLGSTRWDMVHTHSSKAGALGRIAARLRGIPCVHTPHVFGFEAGGGWLRRQFYRAIERMLAVVTKRFICVSCAERDAAQCALKLDAELFHVIDNPASAAVEAAADASLRAQLQIDPAAILVGFFGRLEEQKNPQLLVAVAAELAVAEPQLHFLVVGSGSERCALLAAVEAAALESRFTFCEQQLDLAPFWRAIDIFILPSRWEALPYTLLDALSYGVPILASDLPSLVELQGESCGMLLFASGDSQACANQLGAMIAHKKAGTLLPSGFKGAGERYRFDVFCGKHRALYSELLA